MGQLVGDDALQLSVVQLVDDAPREGDGVGAVADAAGEGVERIVLDDVHLRHLHAGGDA